MTENETPETEAPQDDTAEETPVAQPVSEKAADQAPDAATEDGEESPIPYTVKEIKSEEGSIQRYCFEVEYEELGKKMSEILENLRKTVIIDGFRRGKAPLRLLRGRFGKDAQGDAVNEIAANVTNQIIEAESLDTIGEASLHDSTVKEDTPVALEVDIEVQPKIEVEGHTGGEYKVEVASVTKKAIAEQLERFRQESATFETVEGKKAVFAKGNGANLDILVVDADGKRMETLCQENIFLRDPSQNLMPEVAEDLVGKKPGETFSTEVARTVKNRAGDDVTHKDTYTITVKEIKQQVLPKLNDDFAKDMGEFETLDDLRKRVEDGMNEHAEQEKRQRSTDQIMSKLIEANDFDAPKTLVGSQEYQNIMRDTQQMQQMGMDLSALGLDTETYMKSARANAQRVVKIQILIQAIAAQENLEATDEDVTREIERRAEAEGRKPLAIRAHLEAQQQLEGLKSQLLVSKVEDFLMEKNTIKVVRPKPAKKAPETDDKAPEADDKA